MAAVFKPLLTCCSRVFVTLLSLVRFLLYYSAKDTLLLSDIQEQYGQPSNRIAGIDLCIYHPPSGTFSCCDHCVMQIHNLSLSDVKCQ